MEGKLKSFLPELRQVVMDFIEFQIQKREFTLSRVGALEDYRTEFTSLKPQEKGWNGGVDVRRHESRKCLKM